MIIQIPATPTEIIHVTHKCNQPKALLKYSHQLLLQKQILIDCMSCNEQPSKEPLGWLNINRKDVNKQN